MKTTALIAPNYEMYGFFSIPPIYPNKRSYRNIATGNTRIAAERCPTPLLHQCERWTSEDRSIIPAAPILILLKRAVPNVQRYVGGYTDYKTKRGDPSACLLYFEIDLAPHPFI